jgi:hypothetical protein
MCHSGQFGAKIATRSPDFIPNFPRSNRLPTLSGPVHLRAWTGEAVNGIEKRFRERRIVHRCNFYFSVWGSIAQRGRTIPKEAPAYKIPPVVR